MGGGRPFVPQYRLPLATCHGGEREFYPSIASIPTCLGQQAQAFSSHSRHHQLTWSGFFPFPATLDRLYPYATCILVSLVALCFPSGRAILVHRNKGTKVDFARAVADERLRVIDGIHFLNVHRLEPQLALQLDPHKQHVMGPAGVEDDVMDPASSLNEASESNIDPDDGKPWCPPKPDEWEDPTEEEPAGAAEKPNTMVVQPQRFLTSSSTCQLCSARALTSSQTHY